MTTNLALRTTYDHIRLSEQDDGWQVIRIRTGWAIGDIDIVDAKYQFCPRLACPALSAGVMRDLCVVLDELNDEGQNGRYREEDEDLDELNDPSL